MSKVNLSGISSKELLEELNKRQENDSIEYIKKKCSKRKDLAVEYDRTSGYKNQPEFIFGIMRNNEFMDFYYNSGLIFEKS